MKFEIIRKKDNLTMMHVEESWGVSVDKAAVYLKIIWSFVLGADMNSMMKRKQTLTPQEIDYEFKKAASNLDTFLQLPLQTLQQQVNIVDKEYFISPVFELPNTVEDMFRS